MALDLFDRLWHQTFRQPYQLAKVVDRGEGQTIILLHGIGRSGHVWQYVVEKLNGLQYRTVAFDLLGFGASPKPAWPDYTVDDHASAVLASIKRLGVAGKVIIVGHSMGCLVAVRVARLQPDLVKHMVLFEMPLYEGLPNKRVYRLRLNLYYRIYEKMIRYQPTFDRETAKLAERMANKVAGFEIKRQSWTPFVKSLENTIMKQTTAADIKKLAMPIDVIYGNYDMLVIRGKPKEVFGSDNTFITAHTVRTRHIISPKAGSFIVQRIEAAEHPERAQKKGKTKRIVGNAKRRLTTAARRTR